MIANDRGKSKDSVSTYPEGPWQNDKDNRLFEEWGDSNSTSYSLRIGFLNIQSFPSDTSHYKNSNILM